MIPLGQTNSSDSSDIYSQLKIVLFSEILKSGDGRTDTTCESNDDHQPKQVDQYDSTSSEIIHAAETYTLNLTSCSYFHDDGTCACKIAFLNVLSKKFVILIIQIENPLTSQCPLNVVKAW